MTANEQALLDRFFQAFRQTGKPSDFAELTIHHAFPNPETMFNPLLIDGRDEIVTRAIRECEEAAAVLKVYRKALAERRAYLDDAPSVPVVRLERRYSVYENRVYYYVKTFRRLTESGEDVYESTRKFSGRDWRKAAAAFEKYAKDHPGAIAENAVQEG